MAHYCQPFRDSMLPIIPTQTLFSEVRDLIWRGVPQDVRDLVPYPGQYYHIQQFLEEIINGEEELHHAQQQLQANAAAAAVVAQPEQDAAPGYHADDNEDDDEPIDYMSEDYDDEVPEHVIIASDDEYTGKEDPSEDEMFGDEGFSDGDAEPESGLSSN